MLKQISKRICTFTVENWPLTHFQVRIPSLCVTKSCPHSCAPQMDTQTPDT